MMLYISMKFHENVVNGFKVIERTRKDHFKFRRGITLKIYRQELRFLWSARRLMMLCISMKFMILS